MRTFSLIVVAFMVVFAAGCSDPYSGTQQPVTQPLFVSSTNAGRLSSIEVKGCTIKAFLDGVVVTLEAQAFKVEGEERGEQPQASLSGVEIWIGGLTVGYYEVELFTTVGKIGSVGIDVKPDGSCSRFSVTTLMIH